jgi:hypothetical protein
VVAAVIKDVASSPLPEPEKALLRFVDKSIAIRFTSGHPISPRCTRPAGPTRHLLRDYGPRASTSITAGSRRPVCTAQRGSPSHGGKGIRAIRLRAHAAKRVTALWRAGSSFCVPRHHRNVRLPGDLLLCGIYQAAERAALRWTRRNRSPRVRRQSHCPHSAVRCGTRAANN